MKNYEAIVCFTRPWEVPRFQRLARRMRRQLGGSGIVIRHITLWETAARWLTEGLEPGEEVVHLAPLLRAAPMDPESVDRLEALALEMEAWSNTPLATMIAAERYLPQDHTERREFALRHLHVLEGLIPERSLLFSNAVDHLCYWLACDLARWRGGDFFGLGASGRPSGRTQVMRDSCRLWLPREPDVEHHEETGKQREEIRTGVVPDYMRIQAPTIKWSQRIRWKRALYRERALGNYFVTPSMIYGINRLSRPTTIHRWRQALKIMKPCGLDDLKRPFIYLPLHLEPEASTWVWASHLRDQAFLIDTLARALPSGVDLVVKENPKMHGHRPASFYERSRQHPSVVWIEPSTSSRDLMDRSAAVVSLTGTACLEALVSGGAAALVGNPPYASVFTDIPKIQDLEQLPAILSRLVSGELEPNKEQVEKQYARYIANLVPVSNLCFIPHEGLPILVYEDSEALDAFMIEALEADEPEDPTGTVSSR